MLECGSARGRRPLLHFGSKFGSLKDRDAELLREAVGWDVGSLGGFGNIQLDENV